MRPMPSNPAPRAENLRMTDMMFQVVIPRGCRFSCDRSRCITSLQQILQHRQALMPLLSGGKNSARRGNSLPDRHPRASECSAASRCPFRERHPERHPEKDPGLFASLRMTQQNSWTGHHCHSERRLPKRRIPQKVGRIMPASRRTEEGSFPIPAQLCARSFSWGLRPLCCSRGVGRCADCETTAIDAPPGIEFRGPEDPL